jgi:hypothetical protein
MLVGSTLETLCSFMAFFCENHSWHLEVTLLIISCHVNLFHGMFDFKSVNLNSYRILSPKFDSFDLKSISLSCFLMIADEPF